MAAYYHNGGGPPWVTATVLAGGIGGDSVKAALHNNYNANPGMTSGDLFHGPNSVSAILTAPLAINEQLIHFNPGHAQPLHDQPSIAALPRTLAKPVVP